MIRIIVEPASTGNDLSQRFVKAVSLLNEKGIKLYSGTKLVSKYAVIVAEDPLLRRGLELPDEFCPFVNGKPLPHFASRAGSHRQFSKAASACTTVFSTEERT